MLTKVAIKNHTRNPSNSKKHSITPASPLFHTLLYIHARKREFHSIEASHPQVSFEASRPQVALGSGALLYHSDGKRGACTLKGACAREQLHPFLVIPIHSYPFLSTPIHSYPLPSGWSKPPLNCSKRWKSQKNRFFLKKVAEIFAQSKERL